MTVVAAGRPRKTRPVGPNHLGELFREAREELEISGESLAAEIGTTQSVISQYENGRRKPEPARALRIADHLRIPRYRTIAALWADKTGDLKLMEENEERESWVRLLESFDPEERRKLFDYIESTQRRHERANASESESIESPPARRANKRQRGF